MQFRRLSNIIANSDVIRLKELCRHRDSHNKCHGNVVEGLCRHNKCHGNVVGGCVVIINAMVMLLGVVSS